MLFFLPHERGCYSANSFPFSSLLGLHLVFPLFVLTLGGIYTTTGSVFFLFSAEYLYVESPFSSHANILVFSLSRFLVAIPPDSLLPLFPFTCGNRSHLTGVPPLFFSGRITRGMGFSSRLSVFPFASVFFFPLSRKGWRRRFYHPLSSNISPANPSSLLSSRDVPHFLFCCGLLPRFA